MDASGHGQVGQVDMNYDIEHSEWGGQASTCAHTDTMVCVCVHAHMPMQWWVSLAVSIPTGTHAHVMGTGKGHSRYGYCRRSQKCDPYPYPRG